MQDLPSQVQQAFSMSQLHTGNLVKMVRENGEVDANPARLQFSCFGCVTPVDAVRNEAVDVAPVCFCGLAHSAMACGTVEMQAPLLLPLPAARHAAPTSLPARPQSFPPEQCRLCWRKNWPSPVLDNSRSRK